MIALPQENPSLESAKRPSLKTGGYLRNKKKFHRSYDEDDEEITPELPIDEEGKSHHHQDVMIESDQEATTSKRATTSKPAHKEFLQTMADTTQEGIDHSQKPTASPSQVRTNPLPMMEGQCKEAASFKAPEPRKAAAEDTHAMTMPSPSNAVADAETEPPHVEATTAPSAWQDASMSDDSASKNSMSSYSSSGFSVFDDSESKDHYFQLLNVDSLEQLYNDNFLEKNMEDVVTILG
jgi:hypothetical protein